VSKLQVNFRTNRGVVTDRTFLPGEGISIYGKAGTALGLVFNPGTLVSLNIKKTNGESIYSNSTLTDILGDFDFYFVTPLTGARQLEIIVTASYIDGNDSLLIPIGINEAPRSDPRDLSPGSIFDWIPVIALGIGGALIYSLIKK